jgi:hypothetical protein
MVTKTVIFFASQNWTVPIDVDPTSNSAICLGAGGAGGSGFGDTGVVGSGARGGDCAVKNNIALTPGQIIPVTVGIGGTGLTANAQGVRNPGSPSSFGPYCSAAGGAGGLYGEGSKNSSPQNGPTFGDIVFAGGLGEAATVAAAAGGGAAGPFGNGGNGSGTTGGAPGPGSGWTDTISLLTAASGAGGGGLLSPVGPAWNTAPGGNYGGGGAGLWGAANPYFASSSGPGGLGVVIFTYRVRNQSARVYMIG